MSQACGDTYTHTHTHTVRERERERERDLLYRFHCIEVQASIQRRLMLPERSIGPPPGINMRS